VRETDLKTINPILRRLIPLFTFWLKWLDLRAVAYLNSIGTIWIANSKFIQQTIREIYHTDSTVIYPPIELHTFGSVQRDPSKLDDFYFYFGRISFHKKVDLIVQACLDLGRRVKIAGLSGFAPEMQKLRQMVAEAEANHPSKIGLVEFIERRITDQEVKQYLSRCRAFLFPAKEDSGMIPVEVISSGTPVIAYAGGGALEYIQNGINGIFFNQQTVEGLVEGIRTFEASQLPTPDQIKQTVLPFGEQAFTQRVRDVVGF
jgi:glycosyltransferase involved in cell wall biosynthesis